MEPSIVDAGVAGFFHRVEHAPEMHGDRFLHLDLSEMRMAEFESLLYEFALILKPTLHFFISLRRVVRLPDYQDACSHKLVPVEHDERGLGFGQGKWVSPGARLSYDPAEMTIMTSVHLNLHCLGRG
jgi:hypothetical protein